MPRILARDAHRCRICGGRATEVHHTRPGVETDDSLWSLCSACHRTITQMQAGRARWADAEHASAPIVAQSDALDVGLFAARASERAPDNRTSFG
ncbi:MAG TPA: HNH endonuclease signature motif containing protein [Caldimonas sp.]|nr:HNH endonuclease signature motif containing protein [Caldimonas sp.]